MRIVCCCALCMMSDPIASIGPTPVLRFTMKVTDESKLNPQAPDVQTTVEPYSAYIARYKAALATMSSTSSAAASLFPVLNLPVVRPDVKGAVQVLGANGKWQNYTNGVSAAVPALAVAGTTAVVAPAPIAGTTAGPAPACAGISGILSAFSRDFGFAPVPVAVPERAPAPCRAATKKEIVLHAVETDNKFRVPGVTGDLFPLSELKFPEQWSWDASIPVLQERGASTLRVCDVIEVRRILEDVYPYIGKIIRLTNLVLAGGSMSRILTGSPTPSTTSTSSAPARAPM